MDSLFWFTRLVFLIDLLFVSVWMFVVLPYAEPVETGLRAMHDSSVYAAWALTGLTVLIGLAQLWIETLRLTERGPIVNALILFLMAAAVILVERWHGG